MEEQRCKMTATAASDYRCKNLLDPPTIAMQDPRYESLILRTEAIVEDSRWNPVTVETEDPRCAGLSSSW